MPPGPRPFQNEKELSIIERIANPSYFLDLVALSTAATV